MVQQCYWAAVDKTCMASSQRECMECSHYVPVDSESIPNASDLGDCWLPDDWWPESDGDLSTPPFREDVFMPCKGVEDNDEE